MEGYFKLYKRQSEFLFFQSTEWVFLGKEDICLARISNAREQSRRIRYADIEAIRIQKIPFTRHLKYYIPLGLLFLLAICLSFTQDGAVAALILASGLSLLLAILIYILPSCRFTLQTAVRTYQLNGVRKRKLARKVADALTERIQEVQGTMSPEQLDLLNQQTESAPKPPPLTGKPPKLQFQSE